MAEKFAVELLVHDALVFTAHFPTLDDALMVHADLLGALDQDLTGVRTLRPDGSAVRTTAKFADWPILPLKAPADE